MRTVRANELTTGDYILLREPRRLKSVRTTVEMGVLGVTLEIGSLDGKTIGTAFFKRRTKFLLLEQRDIVAALL